jgi:hypothetical protein
MIALQVYLSRDRGSKYLSAVIDGDNMNVGKGKGEKVGFRM